MSFPLWSFTRSSAILQLSLIYFLVTLASVYPQRLHLNQIIFNNLDPVALLMFLSSVSVLAKVIYIFLSPDWKGEVLLTGKESLLRCNYSVYLPSALSSIYLSSLSILSSLTLNFQSLVVTLTSMNVLTTTLKLIDTEPGPKKGTLASPLLKLSSQLCLL